MIEFGRLSVTLLIGAAQGAALAVLLLLAPANQVANRFLALLILALALMVTPYIIGFAGFYDRYPWLSFAPFQTGLAFGPLLYLHVVALTGGPLPPQWRAHFAPYLVQFLAQALVFPFPLATKDWWDTVAHSPFIAPTLTIASIASVAIYGRLVWRRYQAYQTHLAATRTDGAAFDPSWIRNALFAVCAGAAVWAGFFVAKQIDPSRTYFDAFWMYVGLSGLGVYLGVEGWRNAGLRYPPLAPEPTEPGRAAEAQARRDWRAQAQTWAAAVEAQGLWRDPDVTLASLAKALGTNTAYLSRALNEGLGVTFSAFINSRRIEAVKRTLADPANTDDILAIALDAGFNSKASFNRAFAEFAGTSPTAYRRAARQNAPQSAKSPI